MKELEEIDPLSVVIGVLKEASKYKLAPEVVLLALIIVKNNPDIDLARAITLSHDEVLWGLDHEAILLMQAEDTSEEEGLLKHPWNPELALPIKYAQAKKNMNDE